MSESLQILYMQARLADMAGQKWNMPINEVARVFNENSVFSYIEELWGLFHVEGDEAVWEDISEYLAKREALP